MRAATLANMNWTGSRRFTFADIDSTPEFSHYFRFDEASAPCVAAVAVGANADATTAKAAKAAV